MNVDEAIETRRAYRALTRTDITNDIITKLGRAAQLAPSCFNKQPWQFIFISDGKKLKELNSALSEKNSWAAEASLLIAVFTEAGLDCRLKDGRDYYLYDTGIACGFIMLQAVELGLVAHPMAGFDQDSAKKILEIPESMKLINIIAVGRHSENYKELLDEQQAAIEENRPDRKTLSDFIYVDSYS
ncbi:MAG: nitroreductase family protein [Spirochaetales bacterium]|uniref:Nitroreductase family protein n=1 Tax=Candidatus Thalassospirochaeta sargassi TaxID=3119039 RepID=A0AAJ1MK56_9SPIO|nr:nitroreductase family protein [Spirochaetales bacterium]